MTEIQQDKELRASLSTLVHLHHYGFCENTISRCYKRSREHWEPNCEARAKQYEDKLVDFVKARDKELERRARIAENRRHLTKMNRSGRPMPENLLTPAYFERRIMKLEREELSS